MARLYITAADLAELTGVSPQMARKAIRGALQGKTWRGRLLKVRQVAGSSGGGRSGSSWEVALSSLPEALQRAFRGGDDAPVIVTDGRPDAAPKQMASVPQGETIRTGLAAIEQALAYPAGSPERAAAQRAMAKPGERGRSLRTLQRKTAGCEREGISFLAHKRPSNAGERRYYVSRVFDQAFLAAGYDPAQLPHWGARRDQLLRDMWASRAQRAKWSRVQLEAQTSLRRELIAAGIDLPKAVVTISKRAVFVDQHYREVDVFDHDRKTWDDGKTRFRRDQTKWKPLEQVVLDVKHIDVVVRRPNGSDVYPKMIGFLDSGNKRMFTWFVFPPKGEAVRQEHVVTAFIAMVQHPEWGLPQSIYMDNGSENIKLATIEPLLAMISDAKLKVKAIVHAKPHSGASKPIESRFQFFDQHIFSLMQGYVGPLRTNKKSEQLGRTTKPYPAGYEAFEEEVRLRIADIEDQPIRSGPQAGRSPHEAFLAYDHRPITVDPLALDAHFAKFITRRVDRGAIPIDGVRYRHPDLPNGRTVTVALSYRRGAAPLFKRPGGDWAYLDAEMLFDPRAIDGAQAASRAQSGDRRRVRDMRQETSRPDLDGNIRFRAQERVTRLPTAAAENPIMHVIASQQAEEMAAARAAGERLKLSAPSEAERRRARQMAVTEELEKHYGIKRA